MTTAGPDRTVSTVGLVGLGVLGAAIGRRLGAVGMTVEAVDSRQAARLSWSLATGSEAVASVAEAVASVAEAVASVGGAGSPDAWLVVVRGAHQVRSVLSEIPAGEGAAPVLVLTSLAGAEAEALTRPPYAGRVWPVGVSGGELAALRGQMVAAVPDALPTSCRRFLRATVADRIVDVGGPAQVALAKSLVNAMIAYQFRALDRVLEVGEASGLAPTALLELVQRGSSGSGALQAVFEYDAPLADAPDELAAALGPVEPVGVPRALDAARRRLGRDQRGHQG